MDTEVVKAPTLGLDCPYDVYRIPDGVRFLVVARSGDNTAEICDYLHGGAVLIVLDDNAASVFVDHRRK